LWTVGGTDPDRRSRRNAIAAKFEIAQRTARHRRHRRDHPQCFLEHHFGEFKGIELLGRDIGTARRRNRQAFGAHLFLPFGIALRAWQIIEVTEEVIVSCAAIIRKFI
jgi:hypothetical protein